MRTTAGGERLLELSSSPVPVLPALTLAQALGEAMHGERTGGADRHAAAATQAAVVELQTLVGKR
jgi:hypothetical protein